MQISSNEAYRVRKENYPVKVLHRPPSRKPLVFLLIWIYINFQQNVLKGKEKVCFVFMFSRERAENTENNLLILSFLDAVSLVCRHRKKELVRDSATKFWLKPALNILELRTRRKISQKFFYKKKTEIRSSWWEKNFKRRTSSQPLFTWCKRLCVLDTRISA